MHLIDERLEDLIDETCDEDFVESVSYNDLKKLYNANPDLKELFDKVLDGQAGVNHKHAVMSLIKSLKKDGLSLTPEKPYEACDLSEDNSVELKSLSFNYYLLQHVFKRLLKDGDCTIGYFDNAIELVSRNNKREFKNLIRGCKDENIKELFINLEARIKSVYTGVLMNKLVNRVTQLKTAINPFINELFNNTDKVPVSSYYKMRVTKELILKGLKQVPNGVIPWTKAYIKGNNSLRLLSDYMPRQVLNSMIKAYCFKYDGDLDQLITDVTSDIKLPKGVKGIFITGYLRRIYKPMMVHDLKNALKPGDDYGECLNDLLNRNIDLLISNGVKDVGVEVERNKEDFVYKFYSKAMFFSKRVDKLLFLMPADEEEGINAFKKEVVDGNYIMMPEDIFDKIRVMSNFNAVFEECANFPLVSRNDYDNCSLVRQYINPEKFNQLAKKTVDEFTIALEKVSEVYDMSELIREVKKIL